MNDLSDTPRHPIRDACARAGVAPGTLRFWERLYGLLTPGRSRGNYRLYSDRDVAVLRWVKERLDAGRLIRMAAAEVDAMRRTGRWPAAPPLRPGAGRLRAESTALALADVEDRLQALSPAPRLGFGGVAFERWPVLRARVPGCYLGGDPVSATVRARALLSTEPAR